MVVEIQQESEWQILTVRVTEAIKKSVVSSIRGAIETDLPDYVTKFHLATRNGIGMQIGNFINTRLQDSKSLKENDIELREFKRFGWKGRLIVDKTNKIVYSIMSSGRLNSLNKTFKETPHYSRVFAYFINIAQIAQQKQISFTDYPYTKKTMERTANDILGNAITDYKDYIYCIISYETLSGQLASCSISFIDKDLDIIENLSLNDYIAPSPASLTETPITKHDIREQKQKSLIKLKTTTKTPKLVVEDKTNH
jgi:hypothetical protein